MGGFFGVASKEACNLDLFYGTDYHSHLGTRRGGMATYGSDGWKRAIHNIENSPFRTKFEGITEEMKGTGCIGCISDADPQPILIRSKLGIFAITTIGLIRNAEELAKEFLEKENGHFEAYTGGKINATELVAALINQKESFEEGIRFVHKKIEGSISILILLEDGSLIAARDKVGRLPVLIGKNEDGYCVSFESFAYRKLGYEDFKELNPAEIVKITADSTETLDAGGKEMKICAFLWTYYGYPTSKYEGVNVEIMRNRNGRILAKTDKKNSIVSDIDFVSGVPDSGTPHAIGYANESGIPFARPFIKYTPTWPRSFMPIGQQERNMVAKMKMIPVHELIEGKKLLLVDDSIVRGTQLRETVEFLYENGAKEVHMRSACPPIMYGCKFLNFSRSNSEMDLIARRAMFELEGKTATNYIEEYIDGRTERGKALRKNISERLHFDSLDYQTLEGISEAIGIEPCKLCTYCWNGKE